VVALLIAILFVLVSASVEPSQVWRLVPGGIALIAVMVLVVRPLVVALCTWRSRLDRAERAFVAWLAPRGIVAAATASAFGLQLAQKGVAGSEDILPIAFIAIFGTVLVYGLTAAPLARFLGLAGGGSGLVLVVGGGAWAREIALALKATGQRVRLWTKHTDEQAAARAAGLETGNARLGFDAVSREAALEEITEVLLMTDSDYFNALAAVELYQELGHDHVYRLPARRELSDLVSEHARVGILFGEQFTFAELTRRFDAGARLVTVSGARDGVAPLFIVRGDRLTVVTAESGAEPSEGDTTIGLRHSPGSGEAQLASPP
jgi:hypothetical protein